MRRRLGIPIALLTLISVLMTSGAAEAATEVFIWPSRYSYGTPSGTFTWNTTAFGLRFGPGFGPVEFGTTFFYGSISNLTFAGSGLSGYGGQVIGGETGLRFGLGVGPIGVGASAGYGGFVLNARGPAAGDAVLLSSLGFRLGLDTRLSIAPGVALRGSWTALSALNTQANFSLSSPPVAAQNSGSGAGSEYRIGVSFSPLPLLSLSADYRSGTQWHTWSGGTGTTTSYSGYVIGAQLRF